MLEIEELMATSEELVSIQEETDINVLLEKVKKLTAIKKALEAMNKFHEISVKYAKLEAAALVRVIEISGERHLTGPRRGVARWLSELNPDDREIYVNMCEEGLTIYQVWRREVKEREYINNKLNYIKAQEEKLMNEFSDSGYLNLEKYREIAAESFEEQMANDIVDGFRNRLRKKGAVGIGNASLEYVSPNSGNTEMLSKAIISRIKSIRADFRRLEEICSISGASVTAFDFGPINECGYEATLLKALVEVGAIKQ